MRNIEWNFDDALQARFQEDYEDGHTQEHESIVSRSLFFMKDQIAKTANFFNILHGKISESHFAYLIRFKDYTKIYAFDVSDKNQLEAMAKKAIELSLNGVDVYHSVNPVNFKPTNTKRGDELTVSYQTAIVVDIDIRSAAHKGEPSLLAADFDEAKSFLPFTPSLIIFSGYGLHAYTSKNFFV